jgi:hypothetical protein
MSETEMKKCPDCAEEVLGEARKCRYCGYRFDLRISGEDSNWMTGIFDVFRRPRTGASPLELLAEWGVELAPGEPVSVWAAGHVSSAQGYLVVTDRRLLFFELSDRQTYRKVLEESLYTLADVELLSGWGHRLHVRGPGYDVVVRGLAHDAAQQARDHIQEVLELRSGSPVSTNGESRS